VKLTLLFLMALAVLFATPALAANEGYYPSTVVDANCTDTNDTPAAAGEVGARPGYQTSGSADGYCDHDSRILEEPVTADTTFGPFKLPPGSTGIVLFVDPDAVSGDTDTWKFDVLVNKPDDGTKVAVATTGSVATEGDKSYGFLPALQGASSGAATADVDVFVPVTFYILLDVISATSWDGSVSWVAF